MTRYLAVKKVSKGMYPATHNFKDEVDGTSGEDIVFVDAAALYNGACEIVSNWQGHRKVLRLQDDVTGAEDPYIRHNETQATAGTRELYVGTNDVTKYWEFSLYEAGNDYIIRLRITASSLDYRDSVDAYQAIQAVANNTWYHLKIVWRADNTFDVYVDGVKQVDNQATNNNQVSGPTFFQFRGLGDCVDYLYIDAYGDPTNDTDYNIGDNIHYRHFKESTDSLELDDVGTQGTSITWVDTVDTAASFEIVQEFNEHKKILGATYSSAVGGYDICAHNYASQATAGWSSFWISISDITDTNRLGLEENGVGSCIIMAIRASQFQVYTGGAYRQITGSPTPVNDTWYLVLIKWYADNTFDVWIDNILYESGIANNTNQVSGIDQFEILASDASDYMYIDAPISSLDSDVRGDNRTFDYHDPYTKTDITSDIVDVINYENKIYEWRKATLVSKEEYEFTNEFFQIYDVNSVLAIEGEIKNRIQVGILRRYPLRDKNYDDLMERITNTFATDAIHDPTDSTSLLKVALPNVDQTDGDLLLADADTEAATYSPTLKNHPTHMFLRDISDLGDTVTIVKANGVVILDDDLASGDTLDIDTAAHKAKFTKAPPTVTDILEVINYFEIFGTIDVDTGERFYKIIDNSGTDKKRKWRYVNNEFRNQTDVDAYAAALNTRITTVKIITFTVQDLGVHNMGTTLNFKFVQGDYNIPQANYYIISEKITSMNANTATIVLSEGLIEESKYSATFERPEDYVNTYAASIYETAIIVNVPPMTYVSADEYIGSIRLDAVGEKIFVKFYLEDEIDSTRDLTMSFVFYRVDANNDTIAIIKNGNHFTPDGADAGTLFWDAVADTLPACVAGKHEIKVFTISASDLVAGDGYVFSLTMNEAAREVYIYSCTLRYYMKRTV